MSKTIDERVVEMKFDNSNFEGNVKQSMSTLERLKQALKFGGSSKGIDEVAKSVKNVDMDGLGSSVEGVRLKFSALQVMGVTALANITNSAVNAGKNIAKALTIDPIMSGFEEYELKINAVQTIMSNTASKGTTMADVTKVLDELNTYADKTIYNFAEMTRNIGTFTAAGVGLQDSASAIQGIANLAAASGSNSQQASTAMYQLSQALAAGTVKLMDWNSVVNAGMGGEKFQEALKSTAREMGIAVDSMIKKNGSFRESLSEGWLSADVLNTTLKKFTVEGAKDYAESMMASGKYTQEMADALIAEAQNMEDAATKVKTFTQLWDTMKEAAQSGWAMTWELIIGDFEEAKEFLTQLSDIFSNAITESADRRNNLLAEALGGGDNAWDEISAKVQAAGVDLNDFQKKLVEVGKQHGVVTDEMIQQAGGFEESLRSGWASADIFKETLQSYVDSASQVSTSTGQITDKLEYFQKVVDEVWAGEWKTAPERYQLLADAGYDYAKVQELVNKTVDGHRLTLDDLSDTQLEAIGYTEEEIASLKQLAAEADQTGSSLNDLINKLSRPSGRTLLLESVLNIIEAISKAVNTLKSAWRDVFPATTADQLYNLIDKFHSFSEWLIMSDKMAENLRSTLRGLFSVIKIFTTLIGGALKLGLSAISSILGNVHIDILSVTAAVGNAMTAFSNWVLNVDNLTFAFDRIKSVLSDVGEFVLQLLAKFLSLEKVQEIIGNIQTRFSDAFGHIKFDLGDITDAFRDFLDRLKEVDIENLSFEKVKELLIDFKDNVLTTVVDVQEAFDNLKLNIKAVPGSIVSGVGALSSAISVIIDKLGQFANAVKDHLRLNIDIGEILAMGLGASSIYMIKQFSDLLGKLKGPMDAVTGLITNFGSVFKGFTNILNAQAKAIKADMFYTIAKSIAVLAGSLALIAAIDSDKLGRSLLVLGILAGGLTALGYALGNMGGPQGVVKLGVSLIALSGSISLMAKALKDINSLSGNGLGSSLAALELLIWTMVGVSVVLAKQAPQMSKGVGFLIAFAVSLKLVVSTLGDLGKIDISSFGSIATGLLLAIASMVAISKAISGLSAGSALQMVGAVVALKLLVSAFDDLASIDTNKIKSSLTSFIAIFGMFALLMKASSMAGRYSARGGVGVAAMAAGLLLVAQACKTLAGIDKAGLEQAVEAVSIMMAVMGAVVALSNFAGKYALRAGAMIIMMSASLVLLSGAMAVLSQLDASGLENAVKAIATLEVLFIGLVAVSKLATGTKATIIALSVSVTLLAASAGVLAMIDPASLRNATSCIAILLAMFAMVVAASKLAAQSAGAIITMTVVIGALAGLLYMMSSLDIGTSMQNAGAIGILMASMSLMMATLSLMKPMTVKAFAAIQSIVLVVAEIALILGVLDKLDITFSMENVKALVTMMTAFTALYTVLGLLGGLSGTAIAGSAGLTAVVTVIGGFMAAVGALSTYFPQLKKFVSEGIGLLNEVASGIGQFIGNLAGGVVSGFMSNMPSVGDDLSKFMENIMPFIDAAQGIDPTAFDGVSSLINTIKSITEASFLESLASAFAGENNLDEFGKQIAKFATYLTEFSTNLDIDPEKVTQAANVAQMLSTMAATIPESGGLLQKFFGEHDLTQFAANLESLGDGLNKFAAKTSGMDAETVQPAVETAKALADMSASIPAIGGMLSILTGTQDLATFGSTLESFGMGIASFATAVSGIGEVDQESMATATAVAQELANLSASVPAIGGIMSVLTGTQDLSTFGATLSSLGIGLKAFATSVVGMPTEGIAPAIQAAEQLAQLQEVVPAIGGMMSVLTGTSDLATFGSTLSVFGNGLAAFATSVSGITDVTSIDTAVQAARKIAELYEVLPDDKLFTNETWLDEFGDQIAALGRGIGQFGVNLGGINLSQVSQAVTACKQLGDLANSLSGTDVSGFSKLSNALKNFSADGVNQFISAFQNGAGRATAAATQFVNGFVNGLQSGQARAISVINNMMTSITNAINARQSMFQQAGTRLLEGLTQGITTNTSRITTAFNSVLDQTATSIRGKYQSFYSAGGYLVEGLANGIKAKQATAVAAAKAMASAVEAAAKTSLGVASPSKVFAEIGKYLVEGLGKGMEDNTSTATNSAILMSRKTVDAMKKTLEIHSPSKVTRDEVGKYIVDGIAEGIEANTSAEEAAQKKAQNIVNAFKEELDKFDLDTTTADLEYQLWEALMGGTATDAEKAAKENELRMKKLQLQAEKVTLAQGEYQVTLETLGASAEETQEAYNKLLQEQISMAQIASEVNQSQVNAAESNRQAFIDYNNWLTQNAENLQKLGYTMERIEQAGQEKTGFDPNKSIVGGSTAQTVDEIIKSAMATVSGTYDAYSQTAFAQTLHQFNSSGQMMATATAEGIQNGSSGAVKATTTVANAMSTTMEGSSADWESAGQTMVAGLETGIANKEPELLSRVQALVDKINAQLAKLNATAVGKELDVAIGTSIGSNTSAISSGVSKAASSISSGFSSAIKKISKSIDSELNTSPTITPVLDLDNVTAGSKKISSILNLNSAVKSASSKLSSVGSSNSSSNSSSDKDSGSNGTTVNFTQNNYSPTALSRTEIYRQTSNQLSALKGR